MCTVTFYKDFQRIIITSNRDENIDRPAAISPKKVDFGTFNLYYPQDPKGKGTWFGVRDDGNVFVLLNGAEQKHQPKSVYRESRGMILLDILKSENSFEHLQSIDLMDIEPFTLVGLVSSELYQFRWDGLRKSFEEKNIESPHIWSSATLYSSEIINQRKSWYDEFLETNNRVLSPEDLIDFHTKTQAEDTHNGLIINRDQKMVTKNVTQCVLEKGTFSLTHLDLIHNQKSELKDTLK